ncbi:MAG: hypothetical protein LH468_03905 [Nocardioides sp.]|nr:hypothetical protein [Nocardioides sp.]
MVLWKRERSRIEGIGDDDAWVASRSWSAVIASQRAVPPEASPIGAGIGASSPRWHERASVLELAGDAGLGALVVLADPCVDGYVFPGARRVPALAPPRFPGGVGNTEGDATRFAQLVDEVDEVDERIFQRLPDDTWFYPGHGDDSTIGAQRDGLPQWRTRGW